MNIAVRWFRELPPLKADGILAVVLAVVLAALTPAVSVPHGYRHMDALAVVLGALSALALTFRRRAPLATWAASLAPILVYLARAYPGGPALLAPLVALYTIAATQSRRRSLALGILTAVLLAQRARSSQASPPGRWSRTRSGSSAPPSSSAGR